MIKNVIYTTNYASASQSNQLNHQKPKGDIVMRKYYQVHVFMLPEVVEKFGDLLSYYAKDFISQVVGLSLKEISQIPKETAEEYYRRASIKKGFYVDKETYEKWHRIPRSLKKRLQYLINQKLMEVVL
jgi:hypothetical protein